MHQPGLVRRARARLADDAADLLQLLHQIRLRVQAARGVGDHDVEPFGRRALDALEDHRRRIGALLAAHDRRAERASPRPPAARSRRRGTCRRRPAAPSCPSPASWAASLPMVVVLPLPLTPMTRRTNGFAPRSRAAARQRRGSRCCAGAGTPRPRRDPPARCATSELRISSSSFWLVRTPMSAVSSTFSMLVDDATGRSASCAGEISPKPGDEPPARVRARPGASADALAGLASGRRRRKGMTWAGAASGSAGGGLRGSARRRSRARTGRSAARAARRASGSGSRLAGSASASGLRVFGLRFVSSSASALRGLRARGRAAAPGPRQPLRSCAAAGRAGAATSRKPTSAADADAADDREQLDRARWGLGSARRVHSGWDTIIKRRCSSPPSCAASGRGDRNLRARGGLRDCLHRPARVLQDRPP